MIPRVARINRRLARGRPVASVPLELVHARPLDVPVTFCVNMQADPIQRKHRNGEFYEQQELLILKALFPEGGLFVDIGANVGNHTLFAALHLRAGRVIPFEPNPKAFELLIQNVLVNRLAERVSFDFIGYGLSDAAEAGFGMEERQRNLGGAKMQPGEGEVEVLRGDVALAGLSPEFIKIDVEGMEIKVLNGLAGVFERARPVMLVEVDQDNDAAFHDWVAARDYRVLTTHSRYQTNRNYVLCHAADEERLGAAMAAGAVGTEPNASAGV